MCTGRSLYRIPKPCKHLVDYKLKHGLNAYSSLQKCLKTNPNGKTTVQKADTKMPRCSFCDGYQERLYLCLICSSFSCSEHTLLHTEHENGHNIAVDVERAELYCYVCRDQMYDADFDSFVMMKSLKKMPKSVNGVESIAERLKKRRKLSSEIELDLMRSKQIGLIGDRRANARYPLSLRGLNNLGSTCFMNSVLQALVHVPPLLDYFMSGGHSHVSCRKRLARKLCLPCDMDVLFSAMLSGDRTPYSPAHFLYSWWRHSENLASYGQQDAHEFFISVLNEIHEIESKKMAENTDNGGCHCIAHRVFSGQLQSDITCMTCGHTSTTHDPFLDISVDLGRKTHSSKHANNKPRATDSTSTSTLLGCLDLFTRPEKLESDQKYYCENCKERRDSLKQMSIRKLPLVLCLHVKRFEHSLIRKTSRKIDQHLQFPFSLDMTPYTSSSVHRKRFGNRIFSFDCEGMSAPSEFEIFAVVTHKGMLESGHYVTYLRLRNQWYRCDDAWINEVDEKTVRASQCYMIFYLQKIFYYKANEELSCLPVSSQRNPLLPLAGCC